MSCGTSKGNPAVPRTTLAQPRLGVRLGYYSTVLTRMGSTGAGYIDLPILLLPQDARVVDDRLHGRLLRAKA